ncbi:hypothetical protein STEG23_022122 [Scotinomys teguina]
MARNAGHSPLSQSEENNTDQHQPEEIQLVTMQLRQIGDSVHHRMMQEKEDGAPQQQFYLVHNDAIEPKNTNQKSSLDYKLLGTIPSPVETPRGPKKPPADKRVQSLDRQVPRKDSESSNSKYPSGSTYKKALRRTASDGARASGSPSHFAEAQGAVAPALPLREGSEFLPCEQGPPEDTKKEKAPKQAQQSWMSIVLNILLLRIGEEPREKASRKSKGRGETKLPEAAEEPGLRKKSQDKKTSRKKHGHRKPAAEGPTGPRNSEAEGQEDILPSLSASHTEEADLGLIRRGRPDSEVPQALPTEGACAESSESSAQAAGPPSEEDPQKPDQDELIWKIVELLMKAGDRLEEEVRRQHQRTPSGLLQLGQAQVPQPEVSPQSQHRPQEEISGEEVQSEEPCPSRGLLPRNPREWVQPLPLAQKPDPRGPASYPCISSQRPSTSSIHDAEEPGFQEVLSVDSGCSYLPELHTPADHQGPAERPPRDRAWESREFRRKILALLQKAEEQKGEQPAQAQEAANDGENPAPACKVKSQGKKSNLRRAFSLRKHSSKDSKNPESRPPRRHSFLPMCVSGHRASISSSPEDLEFQKLEAAGGEPAGSPDVPVQARSHTPDEQPLPEGAWESKESIIHKLVEGLQEVDSELGRQIRQYPSFKNFFNEFSDASLRKLVATLDRQKARLSEEDRSLVNRPPPCAFGSLNKFSANHSCAICTLMQSRGQYQGHSYAHFLSRKAQQNITSLASQSPD